MSSKIVNQRVNFASVKEPMPFPDFLDVQIKSFRDFLQLDTPPEQRKNDGLYKVFAENFPIADTHAIISFWNFSTIQLIRHAIRLRSALNAD